MIIDGVSASDLSTSSSFAERAVASFLKYIEKKLGVVVVRDTRDAREDNALSEPLLFGKRLLVEGSILGFGRSQVFPDEPVSKSWYATCNNETRHAVGGTTWDDDASALYAALAEAQERYIWLTQDDYFASPAYATVSDMARKGAYISPEKIVGFSDSERGASTRVLRADARYLWIQGKSLVKKSNVFIPAQVVSGARRKERWKSGEEPIIRSKNTIGLATWPEKVGAELGGALEVIEREAYMVMWLNQLTLPRYSIESLVAADPEIKKIFAMCERYMLKPHVIPMITDAPTHAIAVILEDTSGHAPRFSIGLNAHRSISHATLKALSEATRARRGYRQWLNSGNTWDSSTPVAKIGHRERLYYWALPENAKHLEFLIRGKAVSYEPKPWEKDSMDEHLGRIIKWCADKGFDMISVPLTSSKKNSTNWHIHMIVMPELQPTYLTEDTQALGGMRWKEVPKLFGYKPRATPFTERPHPFS